MHISSASHFYTAYTPASARQPATTEKAQGFAGARQQDKPGSSQSGELSEEQLKEVEQLKARDREVRAHEMAHLAAAGGLATSGASFTYQRGPDGVSYATAGEVKIDVSRGDTPEDTLRRAQIIRAAALAPAEPSGQDRSVAAKATQMEAEARAELARADQDDEIDQAADDQELTAGEAARQQRAVQGYQDIAGESGNYNSSLQLRA